MSDVSGRELDAVEVRMRLFVGGELISDFVNRLPMPEETLGAELGAALRRVVVAWRGACELAGVRL